MSLRRRALVTLAACGLALCASVKRGLAHQPTATFGEVSRAQAGDGTWGISWTVRLRTADLGAALRLPRGTGSSPPILEARGAVVQVLRAGLHVFAGERPCAGESPSLAPDSAESEPTLRFAQVFRCPQGAQPLRLRYDLFFASDRFHQGFTRLGPGLAGVAAGAASPSTIVFRNAEREATLGEAGEASVWSSAVLYLKLGVIHILTGTDHLAFLIALLLSAGLRQRTVAGRPAVAATAREAVGRTLTFASAFTVAHSLTLILQVLRPTWVSTRWVEPAIAFSVAYVGFDNLVPRRPRFRLPLVFGFGLVHGLGFASVLREIGLPRRGLVLSLLSFNVGVELGQLLVLTLTLPLVVGAARRAPRRFELWGLQVGSGVIAAFGSVWLVARLAAR